MTATDSTSRAGRGPLPIRPGLLADGHVTAAARPRRRDRRRIGEPCGAARHELDRRGHRHPLGADAAHATVDDTRRSFLHLPTDEGH